MARITIQGDTKQLNKLIDSLKSLESVHEKAASRTAPVIEKLIDKEFMSTKSPYGERWAALKKPTGLPPIRGLKDFFIVENKKNVVSVDHEKSYAKFHQTGTRFMKARKMLPEKDLSKSKTWTNKINGALSKLVKDVFKKGVA